MLTSSSVPCSQGTAPALAPAARGGGARLQQVKKVFKNLPILEDASWAVNPGERVGLVGINGSGKSTQLRVGGRGVPRGVVVWCSDGGMGSSG